VRASAPVASASDESLPRQEVGKRASPFMEQPAVEAVEGLEVVKDQLSSGYRLHGRARLEVTPSDLPHGHPIDASFQHREGDLMARE